jgi:predicted NAD/FAD-dependent oxidoreductase
MQLAIIGAGVAGLAAARELRRRRPALTATIYEQSNDLGGRVATRRRDGFAFDHGAQYLKTPDAALERLITRELPAAELLDIGRPVWVFDHAGAIRAGDPAQNADPKWTYRSGLDQLALLLAAGLDVRPGLRIGSIQPLGARRYELLDEAGMRLGTADAVLFATAAPQAAAILAACALDQSTKDRLAAELGRVRYRPCLSIALAYDRRIVRPFYALVNSDRGHPISWLACEHDKGPARCPPDHSLLIAQMAPQFSRDAWELPAAQLGPVVAEQVSVLLGEDLRRPLWCDRYRWPHALPDTAADFRALNGIGSRLFFAGDYTAGQGRVHLAIESGWRVAALIDEDFATRS